MHLLVIRHGPAEDKDEWAQTGQPDEQRPLTDDGRKKMKKAAGGLSRIVRHIDVLATSPLTRAVQTAELVSERYDHTAAVVVDALIPEQSYAELLDWLKRLDDVDVTAIVGHEPHLSGFISWLVTGGQHSIVELKKGGACLLEFTQEPAAGGARMIWLLTPGQLRGLD
jgi:phosphohistidine phosphatase